VTEAGPPAAVDVEVPAALDGQRVDRVVALLTGVPRRVATEAVRAGSVLVDGRPVADRSTPLRSGQRLQCTVDAAGPAGPAPDASVGFGVVYEDDALVVVDKPPGLVVHHGAGRGGGTLVDGLLARYPELTELARDGVGNPGRPGIVHRLDRGTSGLLVVARTAEAFRSLSDQLRTHRAERRYLALVAGTVAADVAEIDAPVGRSTRRPDRMAVTPSGRPARTGYAVQARYDHPLPVTLLEAKLETGRTHQVRVHLAAVGHPVIGDDRYGAARARPPALVAALGSDRLFLHAFRLTVDHPDGRSMTWESPLPADLVETLAALGARRPPSATGDRA
jgi:23S rRNA pseudouridine1911/1915/1917 synthase